MPWPNSFLEGNGIYFKEHSFRTHSMSVWTNFNRPTYFFDIALDDEDESFEIIDEEDYSDVATVTERDLPDIEQEWQTRSDITIWDNYWGQVETSGKI